MLLSSSQKAALARSTHQAREMGQDSQKGAARGVSSSRDHQEEGHHRCPHLSDKGGDAPPVYPTSPSHGDLAGKALQAVGGKTEAQLGRSSADQGQLKRPPLNLVLAE